jgi:hypothetical protein
VKVTSHPEGFMGSVPLLADYVGKFADKITQSISPEKAGAPFVGIMCQRASGDLTWIDSTEEIVGY